MHLCEISQSKALNAFAEVTGNMIFQESVACHPSVDGWVAVIMPCLSYVPCALLTNDHSLPTTASA